MASALINGLSPLKYPKNAIYVSDPYQPAVERLKGEGFNATSDNAEVAANCDAIFLCTKPGSVPGVLSELGSALENHLIISICAGVTLAAMEEVVPKSTRVIRVMPNTPCLVGECASAYALGCAATGKDGDFVGDLLKTVGVSHLVSENLLDAVTGLSGSGPAYIFILIEAMADGGVRAGLPRAVALELAAQTVRGAATMVLKTGDHPGLLKDRVMSPGGTTAAGVHALEDGGLRATMMNAVLAASDKATAMGKK